MRLKHIFTLQPRDLLFLRDARPMAASDAGLGANWPRPDQLWNALINAFHREWSTQQEWEGSKHQPKSSDKNQHSSFRFGALQTIGPFPYTQGEFFFPAPLDLEMQLVKADDTNLPEPLKYAFMVNQLGKRNLPPWISATQYHRYLDNKLKISELEDSDTLYDNERNIGIAINPATGTTVDGKLYQAEYLRLKPDVVLAFAAECDIKPRGGSDMADVFIKLGDKRKIVIGGQQGVAHLESVTTPFVLPQGKIESKLVRWTLLTPALFNAGWLPGWVAADGSVMLRNIIRPSGMTRQGWKRLQADTPVVGGNLIAACIGKPLAFSGWDVNQNTPKSTLLAVPAGSSYVFQCASVEDAKTLAEVLQSAPRSDLYGEKGFGIGICSSAGLGSAIIS